MAKTTTPETVSELEEVLKLIMRENPELITDDPAKHRDNMMMFGTSVLFQKNVNHPGFTYRTPDPPKEED